MVGGPHIDLKLIFGENQTNKKFEYWRRRLILRKFGLLPFKLKDIFIDILLDGFFLVPKKTLSTWNFLLFLFL